MNPFTYIATGADWYRILPELILLGAALLVLLADLAAGSSKRKGWLATVGLLGVIGAAVSVVVLWTQGDGQTAFFGMINSDKTALFADMVVLFAAGLGLLFSPSYIKRQGVVEQGEYYALFVISALGMMLMASAANLMIVFVGLEVLSLSLYVLSAYIVRRFRSQEAGMKYFILSSFASAFLLYGMALTYGSTGSTSLSGIQTFVAKHLPLQVTSGFGPLLLVGIGLMAVGFSFKVSAIPFQAWTPDVYVGAPTPVTAFMSVGTKVAAFVALARVFLVAFQPLVKEWQPLFWVVAVLTMVGGNVLAVTQRDVKRMLAYSSVANAGYMLVAVVTGTSQSLAALLIYLGAYAAMNLGAFGVVLALERNDGLGTTLNDYAGLARKRPVIAAAMALFLFALAGIPPTAGFAGKYFVFYTAIIAGHLDLAIIGVLASVMGMYYYLRVIWAMYFSDPSPAPTSAAGENVVTPRATAVAAPAATTGGTATAVAVAEPQTTSAPAAVEAPVATAPRRLSVATVIGLTIAALLTLALGIAPAFFSLAPEAANAILR
ncbi:MAG: NADH-quinone oxidoreductase subunit N [Ktedonobacterales bacterium]